MTKQTPARDCPSKTPQEPSSASSRPFASGVIADALERPFSSPIQMSFTQMGTPARLGHYVVVDVETTGLGVDAEITEIGATRIEDGQIADEFSTLVRPRSPIPPFITALTGITPTMVADAPGIEEALPQFFRWTRLESDTPPVVVAHNAPFDMGFLRRAARASGTFWPSPTVIDTLALARLALPRPAVRNHKLATLASYFGTSSTPEHRAGGDARVTAEVLLGFIEMLEGAGVSDVEDLVHLTKQTPVRHPSVPSFIAGIPSTEGVYHFLDSHGDVLYVGSATSLRSRVRSYYTASEKRSAIQRMMPQVAHVRTYPTSGLLEARVRELRDIASLAPPYNSASRRQASQQWVVRDGEGVRVCSRVELSALGKVVGPFASLAHASRAADAIREAASALRHSSSSFPSSFFDEAISASSRIVPDTLSRVMRRLSQGGLFEAAARTRDNLAAYMVGVERNGVAPLLAAPRVIWGVRHPKKGEWIVQWASFGRLMSSTIVPSGVDVGPWLEELRGSEIQEAPQWAAQMATWSESALIASDLEKEGTRIIAWEGPLPWGRPVLSPLGDETLRELLAGTRTQRVEGL